MTDTDPDIDAALKALDAAGAHDGLRYISIAIETGRPECALIVTQGLTSKEALMQQHRDLWQVEVVWRNREAADCAARRVRSAFRGAGLVVNPARMNLYTSTCGLPFLPRHEQCAVQDFCPSHLDRRRSARWSLSGPRFIVSR